MMTQFLPNLDQKLGWGGGYINNNTNLETHTYCTETHYSKTSVSMNVAAQFSKCQ